MSRESTKQRIFSRRAMFLGGVQMAAFSVLAGRLYYLQFIKAEEYRTLSENNRIKLRLIAPPRGRIFDRHGRLMAGNEQNYRLFIDYSGLDDTRFQQTIDQLHQLIPFSEERYRQLRGKKIASNLAPEKLKEHMSWEEVALIELHQLSLPGVYIDIGQIRSYPLGDRAAHLLGYVGTVAKAEVEKEKTAALLRLPDFKIGKNGVEKLLEYDLRGTAGIKQLEVNVHGVPVREIGKQDSIPGNDITLTVDARLQAYTAERVKEESAAVVVLEVDTGNILSLVSMPAFDPMVFSKGITHDLWGTLNGDKKVPLMNKAITGQYPPGSTFKMLVGLAGLRSGIIKPSTTVYCPGHFMLGSHRFNCWKPEGHGTMNYHHAVEQSCDTFFYTVAQRLGAENYHHLPDVAHMFGLGEEHDIGLIGQRSGIVPSPEWKMKSYKKRWTGGDAINTSIGQGYVLTTPLQLAVMVARMASGRQVEPRLIVKAGSAPPNFAPLPMDDEWLELTRQAMTDVVNSPSGTAFGKRITRPEFMFGGKTGTSQVRAITQRGMNQNLLPWHHRHHALFVGFAPVDKPKYAVCVIVEHGGGGSSAAAPVARDVLLKIQELAEEDQQA